ncbi:MAG TPA: glucosamine-6-phosphate deaminase [Devosia sp.]|nr:glucosamine-6-phosphate deaminase [Devosia sp.]
MIIRPTAEAAGAYVHDLMVSHLQQHPTTVLGLPTGATPLQVYAKLVESYRQGRISWQSVTTFNLDEYCGLGAEHPASYAAYMRQVLFDHVDCPVEKRHVPNGLADDAEREAAAYEAAIAVAGGIDLMLLGLGRNGHIGFNEPGSSFASRTRQVELAPSTIAANRAFFANGEAPPAQAISMGIQTILDARRIVVLATGASKAEAVRASVSGPPTEEIPGSALHLASNVSFVLDEAAASAL